MHIIQRPETEHILYGGGHPLIYIHHIERHVHGNGIDIKVYAEAKMGAKEVIFARELGLNTINCMQITVKTGAQVLFHAQKWIRAEGEYDNYASVDIFSVAAYQMNAGDRGAVSTPAASTLPTDGSIWLDILAEGE